MVSEPRCFSYSYLVKNYLIISRTKQDDFAVLKCYLISLGGFAVGSPGEPQMTRGLCCCTQLTCPELSLQQTQQRLTLKYVTSCESTISCIKFVYEMQILHTLMVFASSKFKLV